ncbi:hypothetical protein C8P66_101384 [Humitalea rosea]|uniref:Uncharacterized protein n=1 Tax=Humitalea rosea TaxID=990373 RepID=A0A2W7IXE2_9PROT|nr:hypothetical protein [Humitalea rosea]PZW51162.1 hypothetical protein C8P66_101384 [Humitalea rosea]
MSQTSSGESGLSVYVAGLEVACRDDATPVPYFGTGWHPPEVDFAWMDGREAELVFLLRLPDRPLRLRLDLVPFQPDRVAQTVEVFLNGLRLGFREVPASGSVTFPVPVEALRGRVCRIALHCATAVPGTEMGLEDTRRLGLALRGWVLEPA